jgi:hypothetical protein
MVLVPVIVFPYEPADVALLGLSAAHLISKTRAEQLPRERDPWLRVAVF